MESPLAVANFFIKKSIETGNPVTPMKLVKLIYIAHGWHLGVTGHSLLNEEAQAWKYGPVLASVYNEFKDFGGDIIDRYATPNSFLGFNKSPSLPKETMNEFLDGIWSSYCHLSGVELSILTHKQDTPWYEVWNNGGGKDKAGTVIPDAMIKSHYKMLAVNNIKAGIQETLPILTEELNNVHMQLHEEWNRKQEYFAGVERANVMRYGRRLLGILSSFSPKTVHVELTYDTTLYARAELGDGSTLQIEILFDLDEGDLCNTVVTHYMNTERLSTIQCEFANVSSQLEQILLEEHA